MASKVPAVSRNEFEAGPWRMAAVKSHILRSKCEKAREDTCDRQSKDICTVCRYVRCSSSLCMHFNSAPIVNSELSPGMSTSWTSHRCQRWYSLKVSLSWSMSLVVSSPSSPWTHCSWSTPLRSHSRWLRPRTGSKQGHFFLIALVWGPAGKGSDLRWDIVWRHLWSRHFLSLKLSLPDYW